MVSVNQQIEDAVEIASKRHTVFTLNDVAVYAGLEGEDKSILPVLQRYCGNGELLALDPFPNEITSGRRFITMTEVEKWWVRHTLRWAVTGLNYLTESQLAGAMALAFSDRRWEAPPPALLRTGRRWAMVNQGSLPGTYVFPWASVLRANPQVEATFRSIFDARSAAFQGKALFDETFSQAQCDCAGENATLLSLDQFAINGAVDEALNSLKEREAEVIRGRFGIGMERKATLEQLAAKYGITRERVRQIERKTLQELKGRPVWYYGFAVHFIRSGGSLLIRAPDITPQWELLSSNIGLTTISFPELDLSVTGAVTELEDYRNQLDSISAYPDATDEETNSQIPEELRFLSRKDAEHLGTAEQEYRTSQEEYYFEQSIRTRPRMALQGLRSLGRAAHFQEIAEECNRLFPDKQNSTRNWHASLQLPESQSLGIVWIGRKGMYGLEEHGYTRPTRDLFEAAASIVEKRFADTKRPVPDAFVIQELGKERRELHPNSVLMALGINERLTPMGDGRYVPNSRSPDESAPTVPVSYDLEAGFEAFHFDTDKG